MFKLSWGDWEKWRTGWKIVCVCGKKKRDRQWRWWDGKARIEHQNERKREKRHKIKKKKEKKENSKPWSLTIFHSIKHVILNQKLTMTFFISFFILCCFSIVVNKKSTVDCGTVLTIKAFDDVRLCSLLLFVFPWEQRRFVNAFKTNKSGAIPFDWILIKIRWKDEIKRIWNLILISS